MNATRLKLMLIAFLQVIGVEKGRLVFQSLKQVSLEAFQRGKSPLETAGFFLTNFDKLNTVLEPFLDSKSRKAPCGFVPQPGVASGCSCRMCDRREDVRRGLYQKELSQVVGAIDRVLATKASSSS